jgi:hypothetical protein
MDLHEITDLLENGEVDFDPTKMEEYVANGLNVEEFGKWLNDINTQRDAANKSEEGIRNAIDAIRELQETLEDEYNELREMAVEAYTNKLQEQIDT